MNTNAPSSVDHNADNVTSNEDAARLNSKEQNAELLKKYVASHTTQTDDVNVDARNIDANETYTTDESCIDKIEEKSQHKHGDEHDIQSLATTATGDIDAQLELPQNVETATNDQDVLALGLAKFDELALVAGVNDIDFDKLMKKKRFSLFCKRALDITGSFIGLLILAPLLIFVALIIVCTSRGGVFYRQKRIGKNGKEFKIFKFRTMYKGADKKGLALTTSCDSRITKIGKILRKAKIDELPQLINVLIGQMSFVGYRPEVPKYVAMYSEYQMNVLKLRPGITGLASIEYRNQDEVLATAADVETTYIQDVMQKKLVLNLKYTTKAGFWYDIKLILLTCLAIFK